MDANDWLYKPLKGDGRQMIAVRIGKYDYRGFIVQGDSIYQSNFLGDVNLFSYINKFNFKQSRTVDSKLGKWVITFIFGDSV